MLFLQDIQFALRTLRKSPAFLTVAVLSLALGIGANTAIFTLTDQVLIRSLPVKHPEQLVLLSAVGRHYGSNQGWNRISYPMYRDFRDRATVFSGMFCYRETEFSLSFGGRTERIAGEFVSGNYFPELGIRPAMGRLFTARDDLYQGVNSVAVLSYGFWQTRFGGDPGILNTKIILNGFPFTVVGISPPSFSGLDPASAPEVRVPVSMAGKLTTYLDLNDRRSRWVTAFGRLKPGVTAAQAKIGIQPLFHQILRMEVQLPAFSKAAPAMKKAFLQMSMDVLPAANGRSYLRRQFSAPLLVLMATVSLVLLIACANVANLLIARATGRQKEIAVRFALGSGRGRIISQLLIESLLLSFVGGLLGLALAFGIDKALIGFLPPSATPLALSARPDFRILLFNLAVSLLTGILFGLIPALQATRPDLAPVLKDQATAVSAGSGKNTRKLLVIAQVSLSLLLLIGAGLFTRSLQNLKNLDPGFTTSNLLAFKINPTLNNYQPERTKDIYARLEQSLKEIPGVESSSLAVMPVLEGNEWDQWVTIDSYTPKTGELPDPHMNFVSPDYFKTMQIPLLTGRDFRLSDTLTSEKVCIVNEAFAKRYFGTVNALGHKIGMGIDPGTKTDVTVIGVSKSTRYEGMRDEIPIEMFRPYRQLEFATGISGYIRTTRTPEDIFNAVRRAVRTLDSNVPVFETVTLQRQLEDSLVTERLVATLSSGFGLLATILASVGLYGVMAYTVERRTREIGVRMAIGAATGDVLWLVMREVLQLLAIGIIVGLPAACLLARYVRAQLYGIEPIDTLSMTLATIGISLVALSAGYLPARRATRVDPIRALRYE
jgi:predicted permease